MSDADRIREYVNSNYFEPARKDGRTRVEIISGEVHEQMGLKRRMPNVCQTLRGKKIREEYNVVLLDEIRRPSVSKNSNTNRFIYSLEDDTRSEQEFEGVDFSREKLNQTYLEYNNLVELGFIKVGYFKKSPSGIDFTIKDIENDNGCYLFSVNKETRYVGETGNGIKARLRQYRRGNSSQKTSMRVKELIEATVALNVPVDIWFIKEKEINNMTINLKHIEAACDRKILERILINGFNPIWNRR